MPFIHLLSYHLLSSYSVSSTKKALYLSYLKFSLKCSWFDIIWRNWGQEKGRNSSRVTELESCNLNLGLLRECQILIMISTSPRVLLGSVRQFSLWLWQWNHTDCIITSCQAQHLAMYMSSGRIWMSAFSTFYHYLTHCPCKKKKTQISSKTPASLTSTWFLSGLNPTTSTAL